MQVKSINTANIYSYSSNGASLKTPVSSQTALKNFNVLLRTSHVILKAQLTPVGNGIYKTSVQLAKKSPYSNDIIPLTDGDCRVISGEGCSVNEAVLDLIETNIDKNVYSLGNNFKPVLTIPNYSFYR